MFPRLPYDVLHKQGYAESGNQQHEKERCQYRMKEFYQHLFSQCVRVAVQ